MDHTKTDGYVIFGFPGEGNTLELVRQLRFNEPTVPICIIDNKLEELPTKVRLLPSMHFIKGDMVRPEVYASAKLEQQKAVSVLPLDRNDANSDAATATAVRMITLYLEEKGSQARVQHMLVDPDNAPMFKDLRSQEISKRADIFMLVQELQGQGSAQVLEQLLRNDIGDNPQTYRVKAIAGMRWENLRHHVFELYAKDEMSFSLLALIRGKNPPNTRPDRAEVVEEGDVICVLAGNDFDWNRAESLLVGLEHSRRSSPQLAVHNG